MKEIPLKSCGYSELSSYKNGNGLNLIADGIFRYYKFDYGRLDEQTTKKRHFEVPLDETAASSLVEAISQPTRKPDLVSRLFNSKSAGKFYDLNLKREDFDVYAEDGVVAKGIKIFRDGNHLLMYLAVRFTEGGDGSRTYDTVAPVNDNVRQSLQSIASNSVNQTQTL